MAVPGIWRETLKTSKMGNTHCRTWIWRETVNNVKNEKCTLQDLLYGQKNAKCGKCDKHTVGPGIWRDKCKKWKMKHKHSSTWNVARKLKNEKDETQTLYDLEYGEKK